MFETFCPNIHAVAVGYSRKPYVNYPKMSFLTHFINTHINHHKTNSPHSYDKLVEMFVLPYSYI